jgi:hypothetical protein
MKDLKIIRGIFSVADAQEMRDEKIDKRLYEGVKSTTEKLLKDHPEVTFEDLKFNLEESTIMSSYNLLTSSDYDDTTNMFLELAKQSEESLTEEELKILAYIIKSHLIRKFLVNSYNVSLNAITETWNGKKKTE